MTLWLGFRLLKFLGVVLFAGGVGAALSRRGRGQRMAMYAAFVVPGFVATWTGGYGLLKLTNRSFEPWVVLAILASGLTLHMTCLVAHLPKPRRISPTVAICGLVATTVVMVVRPESWGAALGVALAGGFVGCVSHGLWLPPPYATDPSDAWVASRYFRLVAWAEGVSVLVLFFVYMPLKYGMDVHMDGGTGAMPWLHGVLFIAYLQHLRVVVRRKQAVLGPLAVGVLAALIPFGPWLFHRWILPQPQRSAAD